MLSVRNLEKKFKFSAGFFAPEDRYVYAVNGVSFDIAENETFGLVGESGCGKTTTARMLVQMYKPTAGEIFLTETDGSARALHRLRGSALREAREKVQYIFQDPARSLNPRLNILEVLLAGYRYSSKWPGRKRAAEEAAALLEEVGLKADDLQRRPPDFSGGQRQRISIARALIMKPRLLICDEVVSALDVSIQSQILKLLLRLKKEHALSLLFISHDLSVVSYVCDRVGVMYRGMLVESATATELVNNPVHEYTRYLYSSVPRIDRPGRQDRMPADSPFSGKIFDSTRRPAGGLQPGMKKISENHFVSDWDGLS
ncbi:MAG: ABC transporter ATP-binding protein [Spirochaetales bacterium]|nr:ABC transporter ATP-binding protein [Spirochaetales bacterium]